MGENTSDYPTPYTPTFLTLDDCHNFNEPAEPRNFSMRVKLLPFGWLTYSQNGVSKQVCFVHLPTYPYLSWIFTNPHTAEDDKENHVAPRGLRITERDENSWALSHFSRRNFNAVREAGKNPNIEDQNPGGKKVYFNRRSILHTYIDAYTIWTTFSTKQCNHRVHTSHQFLSPHYRRENQSKFFFFDGRNVR